MQERSKNHKLIVDNRQGVSATDVDAVLSFNENKISLRLLDGTKATVTGGGLKIIGFSKTDGTFLATGEIASIVYGGKSLVQKLFK